MDYWPTALRPEAQGLMEDWRKILKKRKDAMDGPQAILIDLARPRPLNGARPKKFMEQAELMAEWMMMTDQNKAAPTVYKTAAFVAVLNGITEWRGLDGLDRMEATMLSNNPSVKGVLLRCAHVAAIEGETAMQQYIQCKAAETYEKFNDEQMNLRDAARAAEDVVGAVTEDYAMELAKEYKELGFPPKSAQARPREMVASCTSADPARVRAALMRRGRMLKATNVAKSSAAVASGVKMWKLFAKQVLEYPEDKTIPITLSQHVVMFISTFTNGGTAGNYLSHLRFIHRYGGFETKALDADEVALTLKGLKKENLRDYGGPKKCKYVLMEDKVRALAAYHAGVGVVEFAWMVKVNWEFLLRLKSEGTTVFKGCAKDKEKLPANRPNGLSVDENDKLVLVLACRKHRQEGSVLKFGCRCRPGFNCLKCEIKPYLDKHTVGEKLWSFGPMEILKKCRDVLSKCGDRIGGEQLTFKSWRAGKATSMARAGFSLPEILTAGEWRSRAYLRYIVDRWKQCSQKMNEGEVLTSAIDESDDEEVD